MQFHFMTYKKFHFNDQGKVVEAKLLQPAGARAAARPKQKRGPVATPWRRFSFSKNSLQAKERRGELCILPK